VGRFFLSRREESTPPMPLHNFRVGVTATATLSHYAAASHAQAVWCGPQRAIAWPRGATVWRWLDHRRAVRGRRPCPLLDQQRTQVGHAGMSVLCQLRTHAPRQGRILALPPSPQTRRPRCLPLSVRPPRTQRQICALLVIKRKHVPWLKRATTAP
jgi:hypothetical protein